MALSHFLLCRMFFSNSMCNGYLKKYSQGPLYKSKIVITTLDQLKKRGRHLANRCPLWGVDEETIEHILLHCTKVWDIWALLFALFGVTWVLPCSVREMLLGWQGSFARKKLKKI